MGAMPSTGEWLRLEIPATAVGLGGRRVSGMAFYTFAGKAWFDRVGLEPNALAAMTTVPAAMTSAASATGSSAAAAPKSFRARWSDRLRRLAAVLIRGRRQATSSFTMYQFGPASSASTIETQTASPLRRYSLYTPELNLLAETAMTTAQSPAITHEYIWFAGEPAAQLTTSTNEIAWYFNDHLGTPLLQTNASANIVWRVERDPYGTIHTHRAGATRHQPLAFPGQEERVGEGEVAYNVFRWYRAAWGRYTQVDPLGLAHALEPYRYGSGNPVMAMDPLGLYTVIIRPEISSFHNHLKDLPCAGKPACTQFIGSSLYCHCACAPDKGYSMQTVAYTTPRMYFLKKDSFFWKNHELDHVKDMQQSLAQYLNELETRRFESQEGCEASCTQEIDEFTRRVRQFAGESMRKRQ